jgi:hypothetical protein
MGQGFLTVEVPRSHSDTPHSVGLLLTHNRPVAETPSRKNTALTTDIHVPGGIRTRSPSKRATADPHIKSRGHWDQLDNSKLNIQIWILCC